MRHAGFIFSVLIGLITISIAADYLYDESVSSVFITDKRPIGSRDSNKLNEFDLNILNWFISNESNLISLDIRLPPKSLYAIEEQRINTLATGDRPVLVNPVEVKGTISSGEKFVKAKFRLKGELADHWNRSVRMSLAIDLKEALSGVNMQKFSIMKLHSRQFPGDLLFTRLKRYLGLIDRNLLPVEVRVNGKNWGIMIAEEHWGDDFFVNHKIPEGPIIKFGDHVHGAPFEFYDVHSNSGIKNRELGINIADRYFYQPSNVILSGDKFANEIALSELFDSFHSMLYSNLRMYFNPIDRQIYPISSDQDRPTMHTSFEDSRNRYYKFGFESLGLLQRLYQDSKFNKTLAQSRLYLQNNIDRLCNTALIDISEEYPIPGIELWIDKYCGVLKFNAQKFAKEGTYPLDWVYKNLNFNSTLKSSFFIIRDQTGFKFVNGFDQAFYLESVQVNDQYISLHRILEPNSEKSLDVVDISDSLLQAFSVRGGLRSAPLKTFDITPIRKEINSPPARKLLGDLVLASEFTIHEDALASSLTLEKGAVLKIINDASLIIEGNFQANSNKTSKPQIILESPSSNIDVIMTKGTDGHSVIRGLDIYSNAKIEVSSGLAALRFFGGSTNIEHLSMNCPGYEDCLNIVKSEFKLTNSFFENCSSDCIDIDFSNGEISRSYINNANGDGIDLSRSEVLLLDNEVIHTYDKGLSIGERSNIRSVGLTVRDANACIAVKDGSKLFVDEYRLSDCKVFSLAAYIKKEYFDLPTIILGYGSLSGPVATQNADMLHYTLSHTSIDTELMILSPKEIENFYTTGFMKKK